MAADEVNHADEARACEERAEAALLTLNGEGDDWVEAQAWATLALSHRTAEQTQLLEGFSTPGPSPGP